MLVKAAAGLQVPLENKPRKYITAEPVEVPGTAYYLRRIAEGDLVEVTAKGKVKSTPAETKE